MCDLFHRRCYKRSVIVLIDISVSVSLIICNFPRLIGFEELGNSDGFETAALELRLQMSGK